jgi:hypothetical protein
VILAQDFSRVCAVSSGHVEEALDVIGCTAEVLSLSIKAELSDISHERISEQAD